MFTALKQGTEEEVDLHALRRHHGTDKVSALAEVGRREGFECKLCGKDAVPKMGRTIAWHFAHKVDSSECPLAKESDDHRRMKVVLADAAAKRFKLKRDDVHFEKRFNLAGQLRIADVYCEVHGEQVVFEAQVSPIGVEDLRRRTMDYDDAGMTVYWAFLGQRRQMSESAGGMWQDEAMEWLTLENFPYLIIDFYITPAKLEVWDSQKVPSQ